MMQASISTHHSIIHPRETCSSACTLRIPAANSNRSSTSAGGGARGGSGSSNFFDRFCGVFSPRKQPSPERKSGPLLHAPGHRPTLALPDHDDAAGRNEDTRQQREPEYSDYFGRVFRFFDEDGDGKISPSELRRCMRTVGEELSAEDAEAVVESTDSDGDGLLGFEDFVRLVEVEGEEERARDLREAFCMYATTAHQEASATSASAAGCGNDETMCITPRSLSRMLARLGERRTLDQCKRMIQRFDLNGDGVLSFDEFKIMML